MVKPAVSRQEVANRSAVDTKGLERVAWVGNGAFAVVQDFERDGTPVVVAWNRETGELKQQPGWLWLRSEQASAAVWMVPMTAEKVSELIDGPGGTPYPLA